MSQSANTPSAGNQDARTTEKPLLSVVAPAFNEASILAQNLETLCDYLESIETDYDWELIIVNDGSTDGTGELAETFAERRNKVLVLHHITNFGLGQAFRTAFHQCRGDYIVTLDIDLSYSPQHIGRMLEKLRRTRAKLVLASPYDRDGKLSNVPWLRRILSIWANRFLAMLAAGHLSTLTCMVRAYDGRFLRSLDLRSTGMEVMPETVYKTMILRGRIEQVPAHLDWSLQSRHGQKRRSSMRIPRHVISTLISGLLFRPFIFFLLPGALLLLFAFWTNAWMILHFFEQYAALASTLPPDADRVSAALSTAYQLYPHTFVVGLLSLMLSVQLISLGTLSLQNKKYFEEMYHLGASIYKTTPSATLRHRADDKNGT